MADTQHIFMRFSAKTSEWAGKPATFVLALVLVVLWAATGSFFDYSQTWQLVINTGTTIITFLMVFVLQNAQTRDTRAIQAKLDELILTSHAENRFIGIENLDEDDLKHLDRLVAKAAKGGQAEKQAAADAAPKSTKTATAVRKKIDAAARSRKDKRKAAPRKAPQKS
ncbi:low affinity iron permease family protein [Rhizobium metallidurans]|uniref:Low affinity Fe/Cu permease n=1 Tax=Rhizobium metallidurans TaxID=1265931 RepID=A0A7W6CSE9_9HYPH|nr:low affinity iron permease family protein [Rhizobium metallidurans]MBB3966298.1 low affinity Fe/Cu permease [Rhizobium metallidurans]